MRIYSSVKNLEKLSSFFEQLLSSTCNVLNKNKGDFIAICLTSFFPDSNTLEKHFEQARPKI
jgi:hypothetical protein